MFVILQRNGALTVAFRTHFNFVSPFSYFKDKKVFQEKQKETTQDLVN